jgi:hypothetical protein
VNWSAVTAELVPLGVVTLTSTVPVPIGDFAVIEVLLVTERFVADAVPKATLVAPVKFVPVIVTVVPPAAGPDVGEIPVTVGRGESSLILEGDEVPVPVSLLHVFVMVPVSTSS